jgi:hypothetical protein
MLFAVCPIYTNENAEPYNYFTTIMYFTHLKFFFSIITLKMQFFNINLKLLWSLLVAILMMNVPYSKPVCQEIV